MQNRLIKPGRPKGKRTYEPGPAIAFGAAVQSIRVEKQIAQETLAHMANIERSHMGKIERGRHMPNLALILRIANALGCSAAELIIETEHRLQALNPSKSGDPASEID